MLAADLSVVAERNEQAASGLQGLLAWANTSMEEQNRDLIRKMWDQLASAQRAEARLKFNSSATVTKYRKCRSSMRLTYNP